MSCAWLCQIECTEEEGDCVDPDGNPLLVVTLWQKALFFDLQSRARPRFTLPCL